MRLGWDGWVISQLGWVEIEVAGVETELGLVVAAVMVGSVCLIEGGGGWIFLCLGRKKISGFGFGWKENFWICI